MRDDRLRVGVLFGGRSGEHEISLRSASTIMRALDAARYDIVPIGITPDGRWWAGSELYELVEAHQRTLRPLVPCGREVTLVAEPSRRALIALDGSSASVPLDVVFPVLHGPFGEDGTVQGLLELADIPYVGAGVLASAVGMDKGAMKTAFRDAGLPLCRWIVAWPRHEPAEAIAARVNAAIGFPCFVKPANLGSSLGITKVHEPEGLDAALREAASWDPKVLVEEAVLARELECGVIGNEAPEASVVGELVPSHEFYDYADKYVEDGAGLLVPAPLPTPIADTVRELALQAFRAIDCAGLARVDFFLDRQSERVLVNEINTMPGFTAASMFPRLWEASGFPLSRLLDRLIALALARHAARKSRRTSVRSASAPERRPEASAAPAGDPSA